MSAMAAGVLAFAGCSNDLDNIAPGENDALGFGEDVIEIGLTNNNADTRAARPIGSSAAANDVDHVKLVVYQVTGTTGSYTYNKITTVTIKDDTDMVIDWTAGPEGEGPSTTDRTDKQTIKLVNLAANSKYEFVAYGYNGETAPTDITESSDDVDGTYISNVTAPEEIFAGTSGVVETNGDAKFSNNVSITMERQIAGLLGYFTNIPTKVTDKVVAKLVVYANAKSTGFFFPFEGELNGYTDATTQTKTALLTFDMATIATNYKTTAAEQRDEAYTFAQLSNATAETEASQTAPLATGYKAPAGLTLKEGSCFGACFVLPYNNHIASNTLTVVLESSDGTPLKTMDVYTEELKKPAEGTVYQYDIRRNNFYSIGKKLYTDNDEGKEEEDDDPDPDTPIDVNAKTEIMLLLNDSWDVLHNMGISDN